MLPFLWQMELSKEVKDDAVQLCGSGVMRPGASAAWQQEPRDTTGPQIWPGGRSERLPADRQPWALQKHGTRVGEAALQSCMATFSIWQQMMHILAMQCEYNGFHISPFNGFIIRMWRCKGIDAVHAALYWLARTLGVRPSSFLYHSLWTIWRRNLVRLGRLYSQ